MAPQRRAPREPVRQLPTVLDEGTRPRWRARGIPGQQRLGRVREQSWRGHRSFSACEPSERQQGFLRVTGDPPRAVGRVGEGSDLAKRLPLRGLELTSHGLDVENHLEEPNRSSASRSAWRSRQARL